MKKTNIYVLIDPRDGEPRYVGKANRPKKRMKQHVGGALREGPVNRKNAWLIELNEEGLEPEVEVMAHPPLEIWGEVEAQVMQDLRDDGAELYNIAPGGGGPDGMDTWGHNPERRKWVSERSREMWKDPEFRALYAEKRRAYWADPENQRKMSELQRRIWADNEEGKRKISEARLKNWADPDYRERVIQSNIDAWSDPDLLEEHSQRAAEMWQDPEYREKVVSKLNDPEVQAQRIEKLVELWDDPEKREQQAETMRQIWQDPEFREKRAAAMEKAIPQISQSLQEYYENNPEAREQMSERAKERMADPAVRANLSEKMQALWDDPEFREQQRRLRNRGKPRPDVEVAAEILGVKVVTVYKYHYQGKLGTNIDGSIVITEEEARALKEEMDALAAKGSRSDIDRAVKELGLSKSTVYAYCRAGKLGRKEGGAWVIDDEDIQRFLEGRGR